MLWGQPGIAAAVQNFRTCSLARNVTKVAADSLLLSKLRRWNDHLHALSSIEKQPAIDIADAIENSAKSVPMSFPSALVQSLASAFAASAYPEGALRVLIAAHHSGTNLPTQSYESVVFRLVRARAWEQVPLLVALTLRHNLFLTRPILNFRLLSLIEMKHYEFLDSALDDFRRNRLMLNSYTYYLLTRGHVLNNNKPKALEALDWMAEAGFPLSLDTQTAVLSTFSKSVGLDTQHESLSRTTFRVAQTPHNASLLNSAIRTRFAAKDVEGAFRDLTLFSLTEQDFKYLPDGAAHHPNIDCLVLPNAETYQMLMRFFLDEHNWLRFNLSLNAFMERGLPIDRNVIALMIRAAAKSENLPIAVSILDYLCKANSTAANLLSRLPHLYSIPMDLRAKLGSLKPDRHIFNVLLNAWLPRKGYKHVGLLLRTMEVAVDGPDHRTVAILARHMRRYRGVKLTQLLRFLCNISRLLQVKARDISIYELILAISIKNEIERSRTQKRSRRGPLLNLLFSFQEEFRLISRESFEYVHLPGPERLYPYLLLMALKRRGVRASFHTLVLKARYEAVVKRDLYAAENTLALIRGSNSGNNLIQCAVLVEGYVASGQMELAERVARGYGKQRHAVILHTMIINGYVFLRQPHKAQDAFKDMMRQQITPDWASVDTVVGAWSRVGLYETAKQTLLRAWPLLCESLPPDPDKPFQSLLEDFRRARRMAHPDSKFRTERFGISSQKKLDAVLVQLAKRRKRLGTLYR